LDKVGRREFEEPDKKPSDDRAWRNLPVHQVDVEGRQRVDSGRLTGRQQ
jgi:hypothetical protein